MDPLRLLVTHHDGSREELVLSDGEWTVGRARENRIAPIDTTVSRRHAVLHVAGHRVSLEVLPTRNPSLLNGRPVEGRRPLTPGDLIQLGRTHLELRPPGNDLDAKREQPTQAIRDLGGGLIAVSDAMRRVLELVERMAASRLPVLITGESGTGKELIARTLHALSPWADGPLQVVNCPALPGSLVESELFGVEAGVATDVRPRPGRLELADGGTLFLDEVGDLAPQAQAKLLRFLEDGSVERVGGREVRTVRARVVAATHRDLEAEIRDGSFREDLYFRLAGLHLSLPPLRERPEDIEPLAEHFLREAGGGRVELSDDARAALRRHPYPGNVRELRSAIERAALLVDGQVVEAADLELRSGPPAEGASESAAALLERIVAGDADFWADVWQPFQDRELPRSAVRELVASGLARAGGSVRDLADLLNTPDRYRKLLDFLRNNDLMPE